MLAALATSAGHPGRTNEDFAGAVPGAVVLLDGAGIPGAESLCRHGVAWYTHRLGGSLLGRLSRGGAPSLVSVLADAIDQLAGEHRSTCDLADPSSPQATVAILRVDPEHVDYLMLADSHLLLGRTTDEGLEVITDAREVTRPTRVHGTARGPGTGIRRSRGCPPRLHRGVPVPAQPARWLLDRQGRPSSSRGGRDWHCPAGRRH